MADDGDQGSEPVFTVDGPRAIIRLNRPRHLNRLQMADLEALLTLFTRIEGDPSIRVLVLTGTGRAFSAGFDLGAIAERSASSVDASSAVNFEMVANRLEALPLPTICRLNGGVYGGSTDLALACDFRIGIESCEMFMPAARLGLHYYPSGIERYVSRLGVNNAKRLFLTADKIDATEMLRIGYLTALASLDALDAEVDALASTLAGNAPKAMAGMKQAINEFAAGQFDRDAAAQRHQDSLRGSEIREGVAAFSTKRRPSFPDCER